MNLRPLIFILLFCRLLPLYGQDFQLRGRITDSVSGEPLAFVNIVVNDGINGGITDIEGNYRLSHTDTIRTLLFSYVGYSRRSVQVPPGSRRLNVHLAPLHFDLTEVVIKPGINPAHRIIRQVTEWSSRNDIRNLQSYKFTSYDKMTVTLDPEKPLADTGRMARLLARSDLYLMESVANHLYDKPESYKKIVATRISGFEDPQFVFLLSQFQSPSFYEEVINLAGYTYLNPLNETMAGKYSFTLHDTVTKPQDRDTVYIISFRPRAGHNFDGLKGLLYINTRQWAVENVIAEPAREKDGQWVKIQQMYAWQPTGYWFPVQMNTDIRMKPPGMKNAWIVASGKSFQRDIEINIPIGKRELSSVAIDLLPNASNRDEAFWAEYRYDSLTQKNVQTYHIMDSIGKRHNLQGTVETLNSLLFARLPVGMFDLDIGRLVNIGRVEGFQLGIGGNTNHRFSRSLQLGGYVRYGFKDRKLKYGGDVTVKLARNGDIALKAGYAKDIMESSGTTLFTDNNTLLNPENFRNFYMDYKDRYSQAEVSLTARILRYLTTYAALQRTVKTPIYNYAYLPFSADTSNYTLTMGGFGAGIRFAYGEQLLRTSRGLMSLETPFPVLVLQYTGKREGLFGGRISYNRFDALLTGEVFSKLVGTTSFKLTGSYIDRDVPFSELVNGNGGSGYFPTLYAPGSFTTMEQAEFVSDRMLGVYLTHSFGKLLFRTKNFEPEPAIVLNAAVGWLRNGENHFPATFKTMEKGYYETGLLLNQLLRMPVAGLGVGIFYRFGPYACENQKDNFGLRAVLNIAL